MRKPPSPISRILHQKDSKLRELTARAHELRKLEAALKRYLPASLAAHVELANLRGQVLILSADSAAWATRLRYHRKALIARLSEESGAPVRDMRIKVSPRARLLREVAPPQPPGPGARKHMLNAADQIADPELAGAMRKLARRGGAED